MSLMSHSLSCNLQNIHSSIQAVVVAGLRQPNSVTLLAVSKNFSAEMVLKAISAGQRTFGESYLQEAVPKIAAVNLGLQSRQVNLALEWHFIGSIQSNKTQQIAKYFSWVHTIDREKIAQRLSRQRPLWLPPLNICLQVNISGEVNKSGMRPSEVLGRARSIIELPGLTLRGLMVIAELTNDQQKQHAIFRETKELLRQLQKEFPESQLDTLSMGMSADMLAAIKEGATIVRVGSAIFGERK